MKVKLMVCQIFLMAYYGKAQTYPQDYFRSPLNIPMQLVANFGEIRTNHWHMGLDIRTAHKVNLPVFAAAEGYISRVSVEPGGFGQAIYINHPNGYTTVYGHLNAFFPALAEYVKQQQYALQSWKINIIIPPQLFKVQKGDQIALSGSTGASEGPHVHFEIRNTKTENNLNPLLFHFPIEDNAAPTILRLAVYDRNKSSYEQSPQLFAVKKTGNKYALKGKDPLLTGSERVSFAISAFDHFSHSSSLHGVYSAKLNEDGRAISAFVLDNISYDDTRYINGQVDYRLKAKGGPYVQHLTPLPGEKSNVYQIYNGDGILSLTDGKRHHVMIEIKDASKKVSILEFNIQYIPAKAQNHEPINDTRLLPNNVNIIEKEGFEIFTTDHTIYDTANVSYNFINTSEAGAVSALYHFMDQTIPVHDSILVRILPTLNLLGSLKDHIIIKCISGSRQFIEKAIWQKGWVAAAFKEFGSFQAFIDTVPPTINAPGAGKELINLSNSKMIVFTPHDNFNSIKTFRAELDGSWLRFSNDKGHSWIYSFDEKFPAGEHELKISVEDLAGNITTRAWKVKR